MRHLPVTSQQLEIVTLLQSFSDVCAKNPATPAQPLGMKKHIREMIGDLKRPKARKDYVPPVPKGAAKESVADLTPPPAPAVPDDLSNQVLSKNNEEKVKQLDYQAFESERLQTDS